MADQNWNQISGTVSPTYVNDDKTQVRTTLDLIPDSVETYPGKEYAEHFGVRVESHKPVENGCDEVEFVGAPKAIADMVEHHEPGDGETILKAVA